MSIGTRHVVLRRAGYAVAIVTAAALIVFESTDMAIGWVVPVILGGGGVVAAILLAARAFHWHAAFAPDRFADTPQQDIMNVSRVRVAGFGGLGLLTVSAVVATQFPLISVTLMAGAVGGAIAGLAMLRYRRRHVSQILHI